AAAWFADALVLESVGSPYRLDFPNGSFVEGTVLAVDPGRSFVRSWHWDGAADVETTTVTWTVEEIAEGGSRIRLVHDGWNEAGLDAVLRDDHEEYWTGFLEDLLDVLEEA
ncbi:MAG: SRPBCC domain-containing protein, partial [Chloroflexi bacterium]|nr:SRPBCC domain-containing protein [Chloroflexota bacterium]